MAGIFYALEQYIGSDHMRELCEKYLTANSSNTHPKTSFPPFDITAAAQQGIAYAKTSSDKPIAYTRLEPTCPGSPPPTRSDPPGAPVKDKTNATIFDTTPITYDRF